MPLFSWFLKKSSDEDYEQVLASLALSIRKRQSQLSEIRLRERRATLFVTTWAFAVWVAYVALWWAGIVGHRSGTRSGVLWGIPVVVGPIIILFTRRIVQLWYARKGDAEEKTLKKLLVQQRNKIEEIKKKTNYYSTKNLLDRYDEGANVGANGATGPRKRGTLPHIQSQGGTGERPNGSNAPNYDQLAPQTPLRGGPQAQPLSPALPLLPAPRKQWYDKLADALLGDDTASTGPSPASRYALICERCFSHNGLVKEDQWEEAQYLCPKCGHFNKSARSRKAGVTSPMTPTTPQSLSPSGASLPHSAVSHGFPSSSASLSTPHSPATSQGIPSSALVSHAEQPLASTRAHESSVKSPLSESTVFVEKDDANDNEQEVAGYDVAQAGESGTDNSMHMEVDS
ncbi:hypothetical protein K439DRAFT_755319 [Ramaria rubella]|nr:hypothetical protein K439DRAFT_755319 [Ramaria rubella]